MEIVWNDFIAFAYITSHRHFRVNNIDIIRKVIGICIFNKCSSLIYYSNYVFWIRNTNIIYCMTVHRIISPDDGRVVRTCIKKKKWCYVKLTDTNRIKKKPTIITVVWNNNKRRKKHRSSLFFIITRQWVYPIKHTQQNINKCMMTMTIFIIHVIRK